MRTVLVYLLAIGAISVAAVFGFPEVIGASEEPVQERASTPPPPVVVAPVARAEFVDTLEALGTAHANESVSITTSRADIVTAIHFSDGQMVEAGQLLVEMNSEEERALLAEAIAIRDERRLTHQRISELFENEVASGREMDEAQAQLSASEARVISLTAAIADRHIRAPFSGRLGLRRVSIGAFLQPSMVVTTLDDLSVIKLDFTIPETWLAFVSPGMGIRATSDAWPEDTFPGEIATIDTRLDARTRSATVRAKIPNSERKLRPGMLLKVTVDRGADPVLQIPEEAVIPIGDEQFVLRVGEGQIAERLKIVIGRRRVGAVEVVDGLSEGDRVVIEGIVRVVPGNEVEVVSTRTADW